MQHLDDPILPKEIAKLDIEKIKARWQLESKNLNKPKSGSHYNSDPSKGSIKFDAGKNRLELLPIISIVETGKVMSYGATKYAESNWASGDPSWSRYYAALQRHLFLWACGEDSDDDTGLNHLAHAACNVLFLLYFVLTGTGVDDRVGKTIPRSEPEKVEAGITALKKGYPRYTNDR